MSQNPDRVPLGEYGQFEREERPNIAVLGFDTVSVPIRGFAGKFEEQHKVRWAPRGDNKSEACEFIRHVKRDPLKWSVIGPHYEAWLKGQEEPVNGTSLSAFPALNRAQADHYRRLHVRTVEDLSQIGEEVIRQVPMGRQHKELAIRYLAARPMVEQEAKIAEQAATLEQQARDIADLRATLETLTTKRGPGRPPKEQTA